MAGVCSSRILVVDDEPAVRTLISRMLEGAGYQVLQAEDGLAAYDLIRERNRDLDLLITDIQMPRMDGSELVRRCLTECGNLKILCVSAYTDPLSPSGHYFLAKPFTAQALVAMVEKVLGVSRSKGIPDQQPTIADYQSKVVAAEAKVEMANQDYQRLMALKQDLEASSDSALALGHAIRIRDDAAREYTEALTEYAECVLMKQSECSQS